MACDECSGTGWIEVTRAEHDPRCDGTCNAGCPVPVLDRDRCDACGGTGASPPPARTVTTPGPMTVTCGACGAEGVWEVRDGQPALSLGAAPVAAMGAGIAGWVKACSAPHRWHAVRYDGRVACGPVAYDGAPLSYANIPAGSPPGFCARVGCYNARLMEERK